MTLDRIRAITKLNDEELRLGILTKGSWHERYERSSYIHIAGLPYEMNEGDVAIVFSQFGEIVDVHLVRDKETGKSRGFGFLCYEDQRSTILAVDNLNGCELGKRHILVDHVEKYRVPKEYIKPEDPAQDPGLYAPSGPDGKGYDGIKRLNKDDLKQHKEVYDEDELVSCMQWERELMSSVHGHKKRRRH